MTRTPTPPVTPEQLADALAALRDGSPLVQSITNIVVAQWTANLLLAAGAAPAMVDNPHESRLFATVAGGLLVNTGTPYDDTTAAMREAVAGAADAGTPWVLDPVAAGGLPWRTEVAVSLMDLHPPTIVRGNGSEIAGLLGGVGGRGVDSADSPERVLDRARELAAQRRTVVAVSGAVDHLTNGDRLVRVHNGDPLLTRVTGVGCALGALMAGFAAVCEDPLVAATGATALLTVAADRAVGRSRGPGSFAVHLLDEISLVTPTELAVGVRLS
ncbi:hydroxyethylthiazole kinase [Arsenicicoccus sp. oral taxon 190]|uniref:hydroxyethylthiazole kinase n=1 Tax=Arsenicicoccus sp. oral taxon 190 TaxID=1658671 RepID=UPI00067A1DC5|nr:hydroxyethylthiazole kinase [Arsenicicoccus sp. oral taxon 190]AKT50373.1 hydroxyethylthiazole kinase [Arsenicicoccus sp. oral taxon 190]